MITVQDICTLIEDFAPLSCQESYDNAGLIIGKPDMLLKGVLVSLDVTEDVIDEAIGLGYNMIVSHHPLIFKGIKTITGNGRVDECIMKAVKNDIAIYAGHTNVDSVIEGVNGKIADKLGLINTNILVPGASASLPDFKYGLGIIGDLKIPLTEEEFLLNIKKIFKCDMLCHSAYTGKKVKRIALCGGAGSEFLECARRGGATVFLTGEAHFHEFFTEGLGIMLVVAGHYETEQFTKEIFFNLISKKFPKFAVQISKMEKNPVLYL